MNLKKPLLIITFLVLFDIHNCNIQWLCLYIKPFATKPPEIIIEQ